MVMTARRPGTRAGGRVIAMVILSAMPWWGGQAVAGELSVVGDAATVGGKGLRVTAGVMCQLDNVVVTGPTVATDQRACDTITTSGGVAVDGDVAFSAGDRITLGAGFSVPLGASFRAGVNTFVDTPYAYLRDDRPSSELTYHARFDLNVDGLNLVEGEYLDHFTGLQEDGTIQFRLMLRNQGGKELVLFARSSGTLIQHPTAIPLAGGVNQIFLAWRAGNGTGLLEVSHNESPPEGPNGLFNGAGHIDSVKWGLVDGPAVITTSGHIDLDDFISFR